MSEGRDPVSVTLEGLFETMVRDPLPSKPKIFKVDDRLRQVKADDYEPRIVAIGPIHGGKDHLKKMEKHKLRYLHQLLQRTKACPSIDKLVEKLREMEQNARLYYTTTPRLDTESFVKMLLLDGCFLIELVRKYFSNNSTENDPVFESETFSQIRHDLMLFENQLPFFVLNRLFGMTRSNDPDDNLFQLVKFLVDDMFPWPGVLEIRSDAQDKLAGADHLLGLTYRCFSPFSIRDPSRSEGRRGKNNGGIHINSASELKEAGIRLKRSDDNSLTFENGVLKLPPFQVSGKTESLLRNLMAYEQLRLDDHCAKHVTDYAFFMHCLIRSTKDVETLRRSGILGNYLGGDDKVYDMLDRLVTNFLRSSDFCYSDVFERLNGHCSGRREKWMARLWRDYFNSPWSLLSFIAAAILLGISIAQLVFTILTYKHHKNKTK